MSAGNRVPPDVDATLAARRAEGNFGFEVRGVRQKAHASWYRGEHCNYNPSKENMLDPEAPETFVLQGWLPPAPIAARSTSITAFGSCFAQHVSDHLIAGGYNVLTRGTRNAYIVRCGEGLTNTFALLQQFEWAYEDKQFTQDLWHGYDAEELVADAAIREATREIFERTEVFILTLGLSEVWYDQRTGEVFWRAIPKSKFDPKRHGFKVSSHAENLANLERICALIRRHRPQAEVVFTLSPVPLVATFRPVGAVTASLASKAILRAALDELLRGHAGDARLHYFPSYELVTDLFVDRFIDDRRHIRPEILAFVMQAFERFYCGSAAAPYYAALAHALETDGQRAAAQNARARIA